jgi:transposase, IS5 family
MGCFSSYILRQAYGRVVELGDRLAELDKALNWEAFHPIIRAMYTNNTTLGGRSNTDEVLMVKFLLQRRRGLMSWRNWNSTTPQSHFATAQ